MNSSFTPGPWYARKDPNALDDDDWCVGTGPENIDKVAVCSSWDAHLIAAAPELLNALRGLMHLDEELCSEGAVEALNKARAAIARATGETA